MSSLRLAALALKAGNKLCGWAVLKSRPTAVFAHSMRQVISTTPIKRSFRVI
jgi:hypothetical protein